MDIILKKDIPVNTEIRIKIKQMTINALLRLSCPYLPCMNFFNHSFIENSQP